MKWLDGIIIFLIAIMIIVAALLRWQTTLFLHQELQLLASAVLMLPHISFYVGFLLWAVLLVGVSGWYKAFSYLCFLVFVPLMVFLDLAFSLQIGITGDHNTIFTLFYFLSDLFAPVNELFYFEMLFAFLIPAIFIIGVLVRIFSDKSKDKKSPAGIVFSIAGLFFVSFLPLIDGYPKSLSSNSLSFMVRSLAMTPLHSDFLIHAEDVKPFSQWDDTFVKEPNIVIIAMESTRASALSYYNPAITRKTAVFDALAKESLVFSNVYAVVPHTSKALVSINCGMVPYLNLPAMESVYGLPNTCLAERLKQRGYKTLFMQSPTADFENRKNLVRNFGFDEFYAEADFNKEGFERVNFLGYQDDIMLEKNKQWLEEAKNPFFVFYLTGGPHWPYGLASDVERHEYVIKKKSSRRISFLSPELSLNNYLNAVYQQDIFIGKIIEQYRQAGHYHNTIFILVGDHGENFGEHRHFQHNNNMYQEVLHIPLLIHLPFSNANPEINQLVSQKDIKSILNNILLQKPVMDGIENKKVFSACWYWRWCAARTDLRYKFIYNFGDAADELYDLLVDPDERQNLASQHPELTTQFREEVLAWYFEQLALYGQFYRQQDNAFFRRGSPGGTERSSLQQ